MKLELTMSITPSKKPQSIHLRIDTERNKVELNTIDIVNNTMEHRRNSLSMQEFVISLIKEKEKDGHERTAEAYKSALNSFNKFVKHKQIPIENIDTILMEDYEEYLKKRSICMNTISFYMRILKAVYQKAVRQGLVSDNKPFRKVYTGVAKTRKRALGIESIRKIKNMKPLDDQEKSARDMFLFSFYTRGMSFVDMAYLKKSDIKNGILQYTRRKTGQKIVIKWEKVMQDIVDNFKSNNDVYLLPIIHHIGKGERNQYRYYQYLINKKLTAIGERLQLPCELTMYVSRHSWASIAKSNNVPLGIISEAMGHSSEKMTSIYLKSIDRSRIDMANEKIIKLLDKI